MDNDLKGLEAEIDSAVDRLFIEDENKTEEFTEGFQMDPPVPEPSLGIEKPYETLQEVSYDYGREERAVIERHSMERPMVERPAIEQPSLSTPPPQDRGEDLFAERTFLPPPADAPVSDPMERLESRLLSLEWEITKERIAETRDMVIDLRHRWGGEPEVSAVLGQMEVVLSSMLKSESDIHPPMIRFLFDAKDTVKVLRQGEMNQEMKIYKHLAYQGINARFSCLGAVRGAQAAKISDVPKEEDRAVSADTGWGKIAQMAEKIDLFSARMDGTLERIEQRLLRLEHETPKSLDTGSSQPSPAVAVMVFKVNERLFGVQSDQVLKLFKVPPAFHNRCSDRQKIRLKDVEVRLVDLKKLFSIPTDSPGRELKILVVKDDEMVKGLMIEQVLQKVLTHSELGKETNDYLMGSIPWTYQEHPVEVSVLNVKRL